MLSKTTPATLKTSCSSRTNSSWAASRLSSYDQFSLKPPPHSESSRERVMLTLLWKRSSLGDMKRPFVKTTLRTMQLFQIKSERCDASTFLSAMTTTASRSTPKITSCFSTTSTRKKSNFSNTKSTRLPPKTKGKTGTDRPTRRTSATTNSRNWPRKSRSGQLQVEQSLKIARIS